MEDNETENIKIITIQDKKKDIMKKMLSIIGIKYDNIDDIIGISLERDTLLDDNIVSNLMSLQDQLLTSGYKSGKLTSLHKNNVSHQKFPGINMVRQILKCNGLKLTPRVISIGYNTETGKKITKRLFQINDISVDI